MKSDDQTTENSRDSGVLSSSISFILSGYLNWLDSSLSARGGLGRYWSLQSRSTAYSNYLNFGNTYLNPRDAHNRGQGFAVQQALI